jgi:hypothetical protein
MDDPGGAAASPQRLIEVLLLLTNPINVHGYQMSLAVDQIGDGTFTQTALAVSLGRAELSDASTQVVQEHDYSFHLTPDGFGFAHDLSHARVGSGDRMGSFGHLSVRFSATSPLRTVANGCDSGTARDGIAAGGSPGAFTLHADEGFVGTLKHQTFHASMFRSASCSGTGGGGGFCPRPGLASFVGTGFPLLAERPAPLLVRAFQRRIGNPAAGRIVAARSVRATVSPLLLVSLEDPSTHVLLLGVGSGHVSHVMIVFAGAALTTGHVRSDHTRVRSTSPAEAVTWLSGQERAIGPGDPRIRTKTCKTRTYTIADDANATSSAGTGGALVAHFDSIGDVTVPDGLPAQVQEIRRA